MTHQRACRKRICIIGAGLTGLVAAHRLLGEGYDVTVLESTLEAGGMVSSFCMGSERIEYIYHHVFTSDQHIGQLSGELGLSDHLRWYSPQDALYAQNTLFPFSSPLDLLRFQVIPFWQRLKTGLTVLKAGRLSNWQDLEDQTAAEWLRRHSGEKAFSSLWHPLLRSKFDLDAEEVSAVWIWNKFKLRGHSRDSKNGSAKLGYMKGGFGLLVNALVRSITAAGGKILYGYTAMNISRESQEGAQPAYRIDCILENCSTVKIDADAVIATVSGRQFANISANLDLPDDYLKKMRNVRYKGDLCMILRLRKSLSPYYWTTVCDNLPFVVVVEHTNLVSSESYGGNVVYLSRYLDVADPLWTQPDSEIFRLFAQGLVQMYPGFSPKDIIDWRLRRTRYAQPVIGRHYTSRMPGMDTPDPGIKLAGMAQIYPEDRGMNYAIRLGDDSARSIRQYFENQGQPL